MVNLKIGDKVKVIGLGEDDKTGEIVGEGDMPEVMVRELPSGKEKLRVRWREIRLDETNEVREFPDDKLEKTG